MHFPVVAVFTARNNAPAFVESGVVQDEKGCDIGWTGYCSTSNTRLDNVKKKDNVYI